MPIDLEMILSASPPIFSTTAFMDFGYGHFRNQHSDGLTGFGGNLTKSSMDDVGRENCKKRVWFADDKGLTLTHVRIMSEPSNCPPKWTDEFLAQIIKGAKPNPTPDHQWVTRFAQPASDYLAFRDKIQRKCVSLENVIVRDGDEKITGTIKVKNIAFDKEVFLRVTFDKWLTSEDVPASFVSNGVETSQYDTFSFELSVPPSALKFEVIEFCVCFKCGGVEYWDNNDGENYKLVTVTQKCPEPYNFKKQVNDALQVNINAWSEFASWNHLSTEGPYW